MNAKRLFLSALFLGICGAALSYDFAGWKKNASGWEEAIEEAKNRNDPFVLYFHTEQCGWCRKLEDEYLGEGPVHSVLSEMVKVEIDPHMGGSENQALASQFGVRGYPTFLVVFPAEKIDSYKLSPFQSDGHLSPEQFAEQIQKAADQLEDKHVGRSVASHVSAPKGPPRKGTTKDVNRSNINDQLVIQGKLKIFEEYKDSFWLKLEDPDGTCWVVLKGKGFYEYQDKQEHPLEVGAVVTVQGIVERDRSTSDIVLDTRTSGRIAWSGRQPTPEEVQAAHNPMLRVEQLKDVRPGGWVPLTGIVLKVTEDEDPKGLWIEVGSEGAKAGLWVDYPVVKRMNWRPAPGDRVEALGVLMKGEGDLLGSLDIVTPIHMRKVP